jgi:hypothetical protein
VRPLRGQVPAQDILNDCSLRRQSWGIEITNAVQNGRKQRVDNYACEMDIVGVDCRKNAPLSVADISPDPCCA